MADAAAIIIGNEILGGRYADENGPWLIKRMHTLGVDLTRLVVIPDQVEIIAEEVARCREHHTWVLTSGGIGPTHDDVTFAGIASGLGVGLECRQELVTVLEARMGPLSPTALRMAVVPRGAEFWWDGDIAYPVTVCGNILVLPGVPEIFRLKFDAVAHRLAATPRLVAQIPCRAWETNIAHLLEEAANRFPVVAIGSYPRPGRRVLISIEGRDAPAHLACQAYLEEVLANCIVPWDEWEAVEAQERSHTF